LRFGEVEPAAFLVMFKPYFSVDMDGLETREEGIVRYIGLGQDGPDEQG